MSGTLYLIGTPIGNLEDITLRQLRLLEEVDFICAEDTRVTLKLLNRYEIKKELVSFHEHTGRNEAERIVKRMIDGESCGLVTDAGMPCISDPGEVLVRMCSESGIDVRAVPGPTAVTTAVALSGMHVNRFTFEGFLPTAKKDRAERLELLRNETAVMVFYEAPHKLRQTLKDLCSFFGAERKVSICREITKLHEEVLRMALGEASEYYETTEPRGEYVLAVEGKKFSAGDSVTLEEAMEQVKRLIDSGEKPTEACKAVAKETGFKKSELYASL